MVKLHQKQSMGGSPRYPKHQQYFAASNSLTSQQNPQPPMNISSTMTPDLSHKVIFNHSQKGGYNQKTSNQVSNKNGGAYQAI